MSQTSPFAYLRKGEGAWRNAHEQVDDIFNKLCSWHLSDSQLAGARVKQVFMMSPQVTQLVHCLWSSLSQVGTLRHHRLTVGCKRQYRSVSSFSQHLPLSLPPTHTLLSLFPISLSFYAPLSLAPTVSLCPPLSGPHSLSLPTPFYPPPPFAPPLSLPPHL